MDCSSMNVIYVLNCKNCDRYYIGKTEDTLRSRVRVHRQNINSPENAPLPVSRHIALCAKQLDIKFSIMPLLMVRSDRNIKVLENNFITRFKPPLNAI